MTRGFPVLNVRDKDNSFSLWPKLLVPGDVIYRVDPTIDYHYTWMVLKNRKNAVHMYRPDQNKKSCTRYNALTRFQCIYVLRNGIECYTEEELMGVTP